jgi:hypothetical protein
MDCPYVCLKCFNQKDNGWKKTKGKYKEHYKGCRGVYGVDAIVTICPSCLPNASYMRKKKAKRKKTEGQQWYNCFEENRRCHQCQKVFGTKGLLNKHLYTPANLKQVLSIFTKIRPTLPKDCVNLIYSFTLCKNAVVEKPRAYE